MTEIYLAINLSTHNWERHLRRKKNKLCSFLKGKYLEEYMVLNMRTGNGKVGRIEN